MSPPTPDSGAMEAARQGSAPRWPLVLYFHHVTARIDHYTALSPDDFRRGLETCLSRFGRAMRPDGIERALEAGGTVAPEFLISFDDGYADTIEHALPILDDLDVRAVFFLIHRAVETGRCAGIPAPRSPFFGADVALYLASDGHRIGGHTADHHPLDGLAPDEAAREVHPPPGPPWTRGGDAFLFAYPYGRIPHDPVLGCGDLGFGTVRCRALPWREAPHGIRRTFLPRGEAALWPSLIDGWREQWGAA